MESEPEIVIALRGNPNKILITVSHWKAFLANSAPETMFLNF